MCLLCHSSMQRICVRCVLNSIVINKNPRFTDVSERGSAAVTCIKLIIKQLNLPRFPMIIVNVYSLYIRPILTEL